MNTVKLLLLIFVCSVSALLVNVGKVSAQTTSDGWVKDTEIEVNWNSPIRSRRSPDATVSAQITNSGDEPTNGPIRFVIETLAPATVSVGNADGKLGELDYVVALPENQVLEPGQSLTVGPITIVGGRTSFNISGSAYVQVPLEPVALEVDILTPTTLSTFGSSPVTVTGTINQENAELTLNGVVIAHDGKQFSADVELSEGFNTVVARATNSSGEQITDSISVSLDLTPPYLTIESHTEAQEVYSDKITVTGLVNDIVRGTVSEEQASVEVNGIKATVSNRSYAATDVPLNEGENVITVTAIDESGNSASISQNVVYKIVTEKRLVLVSGQNQTAQIGNKLPEQLIVKLVDGSDAPIAGETVVFRVTQGAGIVGSTPETSGRAIIATTDAEGIARTEFQVGYRTGVANHKVRAKVVGVENEVIFPASATSVTGDKISVNSGNNQRGVVGQTLPAPFVVAVTDSGANVVQGARVRFDVIKGDGVFQNEESSYETLTDSDGRASAQLTLGPLTGIDAQRVEAVLIDSPESMDLLAGFSATAFVPADAGITSVSGVVLDNQDTPLPGVTVRIEGTDRTAFTDQQGQFTITQAPVGPVHLIVDGSTTTAFGEYPTLSYHIVTVSGVDNPISGPVYMVKLDTDNGVYAGKEDVVLTLDNFPGFKLEIAKDSVTFPDGSREGIVSVTSVNASKVPMAPPNGMQPQFIVTIQPVGATFSPAAKLTLPNVDGHAPGAQVEMYSFDHDLEEFVAIGLGTVSEDGSVVSSNPGVGVVKAGWHCGSQPGGSGTAHNCPECQKCQGSSCVRDPAQDNKPLSNQTPEDCKTQLCKGFKPDPSDVPVNADVKYDCKKPGCDGENPIFDVPDDGDIKEEDKKCAMCSDGEKVPDESKEDKACGTPGTSTACYTCKDGSCGNHCEASKDKEVIKVGIPGEITNFLTVLNRGSEKLRKVSPFTLSLDVTGGGSMEQGEACCTACVTTEPVIQNKYSVDVEIKATASAATPRLPFPSYEHYFNRDERFIVGANAELRGTVTGATSPKYEYTEKLGCPDDENCHEFAAQVAVGGEIAANGLLQAAMQKWDFDHELYHCSFYSREARKKPSNNHCWSTEEGVSGTIKGGAKVEANVSSSSNSCTGPKSCAWQIKPVELFAEGSAKVKFLFFDFEYNYKPEPIKVSDGNGGSCL